MTTNKIPAGIALGIIFLALGAAGGARAQSEDAMASIQFPIKELGNCGGKEECKTYCDDPANIEACISFAEKNNLMPAEEIRTAKKFIASGAKGPGGCTGRNSCEAYCNDINNIEVCVAFAEENGLMSGEELVEAKKVQSAIRSGVKPPSCGSKKACDAYCESPDNMGECIAFAKAAGLMSEEEQAEADKMLKAIQSGAKPPACRGKKECEAYCSIDANFDECVEFGKAAGFMNDEEYEMAKKTRGKGPGGCRGKEECDAFCSGSTENEELCINFQVENGLMTEDRKREMEESGQKFRESFTNMSPEVASCLSDAWGADNFEKLRAGTMRPSRFTGDAMQVCFGKFEQQRMMNERPSGPPPGSEQQFKEPPQGEDRQYNEMRPEDRKYGPSPEGMYPSMCEGENCRPPEGFAPPDGQQYGPPQEGYSPQSESDATRTETVETAPAISPESFAGAVILFLNSFRLQ